MRINASTTVNGSSIDTVGTSGTFAAAVAGLTLAAGTNYFIRVTGTGFGTTTRSYVVGFSTDGVNYSSSAATTRFHNLSATTNLFETVTNNPWHATDHRQCHGERHVHSGACRRYAGRGRFARASPPPPHRVTGSTFPADKADEQGTPAGDEPAGVVRFVSGIWSRWGTVIRVVCFSGKAAFDSALT